MRPVLVLRPEPGNARTCDAARRHGLEPVAAPLFAYAPRDWAMPEGRFDGLLAGSAAVFAHGGAALGGLRALPVHAVGETTASAARQAGFAVAGIGAGGLQAIVDGLPPGRYLRLAGEAHVALRLSGHIAVIDRVVYAARPLPLTDEALARLSSDSVVALLHSGEAAREFRDQCVQAGIDVLRVAVACLAPRIAEAAGNVWESIAVSPAPTDQALLSLARQMCQKV